MIEGHRGPCDRGVIRGGASQQACTARDRRWVMVASVLGSSLAFLLGSVVNVALPALQQGLSATTADMQWVLNSYLLTLGALVLVGGAAGDRYGRRRLFLIGVAVFALAALACALAPDVRWLIAARAFGGVGAAMLVPNSLALISSAFPAAERGKAIGSWAGFSALTTAFGPAIGGLLVDTLGWRMIFGLIVPPAIAALWVAWRRVPDFPPGENASMDPLGAVLATSALGTLVWALIAVGERGLRDPAVISAAVAGTLLGLAFLGHEKRTATPMLPLGLFASPAFSGANATTFFLYFALSGALFLLPFLLVDVLGFSAAAAGAAFLPLTLTMAMLSGRAGALADRFGPRIALTVGPAVTGTGCVVLALTPAVGASYWTTLFPGLLLLGLGMTAAVAPLTTVVLGSVAEARQGIASSVNNAAARIAGLVAIAVLGSLAVFSFAGSLADELAAHEISDSVRASVLDRAAELSSLRIAEDLATPTRQALSRSVDLAFLFAYRRALLIASAAAFVAALLGAAFTGNRAPSRARQA